MFQFIECIDANTDYCPCKLSEMGECLVCAHLNGGEFCECTKYSGLCIYQEYVWNNEKSNSARKYKLFNINETVYLREDLLQIKIQVNHKLALELNNIGAYVFLKKVGAEDFCGTPISILNSDIVNNELTVVMKVVGIKTKILAECKETIMLKGPYWNGIQGQLFIKSLKNDKCLVLGRGVGLAPAVLAAKKMTEKNNQVFALLEKGRSKENYFKHYFEQLQSNTKSIRIMDKDNMICESGMESVLECLEKNKIKTILSAGNDIFHRKILNQLYKINPNLKFATVNNATICCGEGSCGSCIQKLNDNDNNNRIGNGNSSGTVSSSSSCSCSGISISMKRIKACKQQYNPLEYFLER